jgi:hypothetical protein
LKRRGYIKLILACALSGLVRTLSLQRVVCGLGTGSAGIADYMDDTSLDLHLWKYGVDVLRKSLQPIDDRDRNIVRASVFDLRHNPQPKLRPFGLLDPMPNTSFAADPKAGSASGRLP